MATPSIPQRPTRSQNAPTQTGGIDIPQIPPRPNREVARSISPSRERYARSPLNDPTFLHNKPHGSSGLSRQVSRELPQRPPSVDFPTVGEEGFEYGHIQHHVSPKLVPAAATKTIAGDLPLHAPTASLPATSARSKIAQVTRTDSTQAAAAGIGRPPSESGDTQQSRRWSSSQPSRPQSLYGKDEEADHGIPEIGLQIPLYKNAGDVQAPTPSPSVQSRGGFAPPSGGNNATGRHHSRTKSGREIFSGPPGSYGMHGHGKRPTDALEAQWYQKHPEALAREAKGEYGPAISDNRKEWALSSEELNRLVHTNSNQPSMGASQAVIGTPDEQIGYLASEVYTSRMASPQPQTTGSPRRPSSQTYNESPLRKMSIPQIQADDGAVEAEAESDEDDNAINIHPSSDPRDKYTGAGYDAPTADLGPHGGNTEEEGGVYTEKGYGVPILASDEASYRPESRYMQPAVAPELGNAYYADTGRRGSRSNSRPNSRPTSVHGMSNLTRFASYESREQTGTPLDDVREYEPLFPDENDDEKTTQKKFDALKKKRPDLARHHFPSRDIWEDTPESSMYQTEVGTPQLPDNAARAAEHEPTEYFETPEQEQARKTNITAEDQQNFLSDHTKKLAKTHLPSHVLADMPTRPGLRHRFPSQDVWEDTPDSALHTTEITPESEREALADPIEGQEVPKVPARPSRQQAVASNDATSEAPLLDRVAPGIPARPKPQVPARPARGGPEEGSPLTQTTSAERAKPAVPARPVGSKIASLQAGFMNDLNNRLKLGPQAPKKDEPISAEEEEVEKAPLADARKGRAKGPSRRKPGVSSSDAGAEEHPAIKPTVRFSLASSWTIFEIDEDEVIVTKSSAPAQPVTRGPPAEIAAEAEPSSAGIEPVAQKESAPAAEPTSTSSTSESTQTGQIDMSVSDSVEGQPKGITAFLGGRAAEPGSVVVDSDGKEHLGEHNELAQKVEKTGHGM